MLMILIARVLHQGGNGSGWEDGSGERHSRDGRVQVEPPLRINWGYKTGSNGPIWAISSRRGPVHVSSSNDDMLALLSTKVSLDRHGCCAWGLG
jgi:hypothetical protein